MTDNLDFDVSIAQKADDDTIIFTSYDEEITEKEQKMLTSAINKYVDQGPIQYSAYTKDSSFDNTLSLDWINEVSYNIHNDLESVLKVNAVIRQRIVTDDLVGRTYDAIVANTSSEYTLGFANFDNNRNKNKKLDKAKELIDKFNEDVDLDGLIRETIPMVYAEGNRILCLREKEGRYVIDAIPLGIGIISEYSANKVPICQIDMNRLKTGLTKVYKKTKKRKPLIFADVEEDIKNNYAPEVYKAFKDGEPYVNLNKEKCRVLRINNLGRRYGVSPIFKALRPCVILDNLENADVVNSKARGKKIIHQIMRKEVLGTEGKNKGLVDMAFAHDQLMKAWKNKTVVYTSPPAVEKIAYVEPIAPDSTADKINSYKSRIMTALGIGFNDTNVSSFSVADISLSQLMKTVDSIADQLEDVIEDFYEIVLNENGFEDEYVPTISILKSEQMEADMKRTLAISLFNTFHSSYRTAYETLGISFDEEVRRRQEENDDGIDAIFFSHQAASTVVGNIVGNEEDEETNNGQGGSGGNGTSRDTGNGGNSNDSPSSGGSGGTNYNQDGTGTNENEDPDVKIGRPANSRDKEKQAYDRNRNKK